MNILIINCILSTSEKGVITRRNSIKDCMICNFAQGFVSNGHSVTILASEEFQPLQEESYDFRVVFFPSRWPSVFKPDLIPFPKGMNRWIKENSSQFDFAIASEAFAVSSLIASRCLGRKLIIWQEMDIHQRKFFKIPARFWYNIIVPLFMRKSRVVARSERARKFISQYTHNVSKTCVDHGANGAILFPSDEVKRHFIIVSRLIAAKGIDISIKSFATLIHNYPQYADFKLLIIGDGDYCETLKELARQQNVEGSVQFHGFMRHEEMALMLRTATAMLINTLHDLNMVSIPEAIISGTPIISNTIPTSAPFIQEHELGVARANWDETDLAKAIENYPTYHANCVSIRDTLTNNGCARTMVKVFETEILPKLNH